MNKINYDKIFKEKLIEVGDSMPKLLLHVCCAPCLTACLLRLLNVFDITLFYSNDNITDSNEFEKRLAELKRLVNIVNNGLFEIQPKDSLTSQNSLAPSQLKLVVSPLCSSNFFDISAGFEGEKEGGKRCFSCYKMRLMDSARFASQNEFEYFATTLTVSPHKNSSWLNEMGLQFQDIFGVKYLVSDFKKAHGYQQSLRLSNKYSIYRQDFCGCPFSQVDRL